MYAVKITIAEGLTIYAGKRGEMKWNLSKIEGWKKESTAEKWIAEDKKIRKSSGTIVKYEIIEL